MANQLKMAVVHAILTLQGLGWSQREIAKRLGINRETVARYIHSPPEDLKPATNPIPGSEPVPEVIAGAKPASNPIPGPESLCEPFRAVIEEKLGQGLAGQRIYQDLVESHGFVASYEGPNHGDAHSRRTLVFSQSKHQGSSASPLLEVAGPYCVANPNRLILALSTPVSWNSACAPSARFSAQVRGTMNPQPIWH